MWLESMQTSNVEDRFGTWYVENKMVEIVIAEDSTAQAIFLK